MGMGGVMQPGLIGSQGTHVAPQGLPSQGGGGGHIGGVATQVPLVSQAPRSASASQGPASAGQLAGRQGAPHGRPVQARVDGS